MPNIETLSLHFLGSVTTYLDLSQLRFRRLEDLALGGFATTASDMTNLLTHHATISKLNLDYIALREGTSTDIYKGIIRANLRLVEFGVEGLPENDLVASDEFWIEGMQAIRDALHALIDAADE
ncbi:MAG: hypothetical protein M1822_008926 [Bathelium mastoideum]|nr:MAG: hypothetical protein M1822_008926 [Bathelium mastoideum]